MSFKKFSEKDIIYNTVIAKPEVNFTVHSGSTYYQFERPFSGSFQNNVKHLPPGHISAFELNIDRPSGSLIKSFIEKSSTRYAWKTVSTSTFDDNLQFLYGDKLEGIYPLTASISRIYTPAGNWHSSSQNTAIHANKKYAMALKNPMESQGVLGFKNSFDSLGYRAINMLCIPGVFYGSSIEKGSIELNLFVTGVLCASATDKFKDGRLIQTSGSNVGDEIGTAIYNHGILALTASDPLNAGCQEFYFSTSTKTTPSWLNFGTGINQAGESLLHGIPSSASYEIKFKAINKIPTITMYAYAEMGENNFSNNPTFLENLETGTPASHLTSTRFSETKTKIKKINKSPYADHKERFENITYISKIGIYDKNKNLLAIATLANPVKKTEKRDYMFKLGIDF